MLTLALFIWWLATTTTDAVTIKSALLKAPDAILSDQISEGQQPVLTFAVYLDAEADLYDIKGVVWDQVHIWELDDDATEKIGDKKPWHDALKPYSGTQEIGVCAASKKCVGFTLGAWALVTKVFQPTNTSHWFRAHIPVELERLNTTGSSRRLLETIIIADETSTITFRCKNCAFVEPAMGTAAIVGFVFLGLFLFLCVLWVLMDTYDYENRRSKFVDSA